MIAASWMRSVRRPMRQTSSWWGEGEAKIDLDRPENGLPPLDPVEVRMDKVESGEGARRQDG